jgi:hypothetical protein
MPPQMPESGGPVPVQHPVKSKRFGWLVVGLATGISLVVGTALGLTIGNGGSTTAAPAATVTATATATKTVTEPVEEDGATDEPASAPSRDLKNSDFKLTVKELDKTCYGSGEGCSIEYRVTVKYVGPAPKPMGLIEVSYEVKGDVNGPQKGTIQLEDLSYDASLSEDLADTPSRSTELVAKVTSVETFQ